MHKNTRPVGPTNVFKRSAVALAVATCFGTGAVWANPTHPVVINGVASFAQNGNLLSVTNSPHAIINWGSFSIGAGEITRFIQQSNASAVLNRVVGQDPSTILGALQSNGRVFLINPNGIVFGAGSQIDVAGLVASTLNLSNADFLAGRLRFTDSLGNSVINNGSITTPSGGSVYLIGNAVTNNGIIASPQGEVVLAAGNSVELVNPGTPNLRVEVIAPDNEARNLGQITAEAGRIGIYAGLINHGGTINANSVEVDQTGQILLKATRNATLETGSTTTASGAAGGSITVQSGDTTLVSGTVEATGSLGKGGNISVLGNRVGLLNSASLDASGDTGGGTVLVGGDYQGNNPQVQNAQRTVMLDGARISVDALGNGDGGKAILWSDDYTGFYGAISARGGVLGGNGGFVETSSKGNLQAFGIVNASAPKGKPGLWLLDPHNVTIGGLTLDGLFSGGNPDIFTPNADDAFASALVINTALALGTSVTITTGVTGTQDGDITVASPLSWNVALLLSPQTLTLNASRNINVNADITGSFTTSNGSSGSIVLNAGGALTVASGRTISLSGNDSGGGAINVDIIANADTHNILGTLHAETTFGNASVLLRKSPGVPASSITVDGGTITAQATTSGSALIDLSSTSNLLINNSTLTAEGPTSAEVKLTTTTGNITLTDATVNATNFSSSNTTKITLTSSSGGNIAITNSTLEADGNGQMEIDISTTSGTGTVSISGSTIEGYGGGDAPTPGPASFVHINAAGNIDLGSGTVIEAGAGSLNPESTAVVIKSLNGNIATVAQIISEIEIGVPEVSASGAITLEALNGNISSSGGYLQVTTNGTPSLTHSASITLKAKSGIGATGAPVRIFDGFANVTAINGAGGGGIVLSQTTGDVSAAKLSATNGTSGQALDLRSEVGSIVVPDGSSISYLSGPVILRAANFIATAPAGFNPAGRIEAGGDITLIANDMDLRGPVIANAGAGTINIQTAAIGRTIDFGGPGGGSDLALDSTDLSQLDAATVVIGNPTAGSGSPITNSAAVTVANANVVINAPGQNITLANAGNDFQGTLTLNGVNANVVDSNALTLVLNTTGTNVLQSGGTLGVTGSFADLTAVTTGAGAGMSATSSTNLTVKGVTTSNGSVSLSSAGGDLILDGNINAGSATLSTSAAGTQTLNGGTVSVGNYTLGGSGLVLSGGTLNVSDTLTVLSGATLGGGGSTIIAGTANVSGIVNPNGSTLNIGTLNLTSSGLLKGEGTITGSVNNDGTVSPGASPGLLTITGNYVQGPTGVLNIDIGGPTPGTQYDQLIIGGNATLGGTLNTSLLGGFAPVAADVFNVIKTTGSTTGAFASTLAPVGVFLNTEYLSNGVNLSLSTLPPSIIGGGSISGVIIGSTELSAPGVIEKKDVFPSGTEGQGESQATGGTPPVCN